MSLSREQQIRRAQERLVAPTPERPIALPKPDKDVIPEPAIDMLTAYVAERIPEARKDPIRNCSELMKLIEVAEWLLEREGA